MPQSDEMSVHRATMPHLASKVADIEAVVAGLLNGRSETRPILLHRGDAGPIWINPQHIIYFRKDWQGTVVALHGVDIAIHVTESPDTIAMLLGGDVQAAGMERAA